MELSFKLEKFEGPLDLLLHLIEKNKVNIYDIPIVEITDQYLEYVNKMDKQDLDLVSEFLVMAATLIDIKSKMLLPAEVDEEGEEIDPREELVARLVEYKMYKQMALELKDKSVEAKLLLYKEPTIPKEVLKYQPPVELDKLLSDVNLEKLKNTFTMVIRRRNDKIDPIRSNFGNIEKEPVRLSDKLIAVLDYGENHQVFSFKMLLEEQTTKIQIVVTFLAILELIKIGKLKIHQEEICGDIYLEWNKECTATITKEDMEQYD